ncbi:aspartyl-phosphate phosphatase Spo0E family protein [Bacillus sp. Marseille-P3661]|uniref:aspartyl-phosphate phosphatase Spo0E family protein n=1 Tax=Bacillus sp. Marseille-P3661 TaxID=1936234 RepID=UPI00215541D3|nr:aspartyl-phosphate phosphatase Spo0E family protein [Bacillus sp. Marseille-P3661]
MEMIKTQKDHLLLTIERSRKELIQFGLEKGFSDQNTIKLSQELDKLINQYLIMK